MQIRNKHPANFNSLIAGKKDSRENPLHKIPDTSSYSKEASHEIHQEGRRHEKRNPDLGEMSQEYLRPEPQKGMEVDGDDRAPDSQGSISQESPFHLGATTSAHVSDLTSSGTHFFDLPQEVRDMIYAYFPYLASIHINQDPAIVNQPALSQVCRRMRKESLDVFYGRNNFFLDLRGWKSSAYPRSWTPKTIFGHWITAIGDENAARLKSLSFFSHNFRVNVRVSNERPPTLLLKFRTNLSKVEVAEGVPSTYTFAIAAERAEAALRRLLEEIQANIPKRGLSVADLTDICAAVDKIQPFLCKRINLGYQGAVLLEDDTNIDMWPGTTAHTDKCDDCGYHRYTRVGDYSD